MANFDFITDEGLRKSLESDHRELALCHAAKAWKAVHVLSGSIIEAILIDYLVSSEKIEAAKANSKDLAELIELCTTHGVLSKKAIDLSAIVRSYRNLIHPGRMLRLAEQVDENGATIAKSVIEIVVNEVSDKKRETYGYTAEQVVNKVEQDASSISIAEHLLRETRSAELKRLLLSVLPAAYMRVCSDFEASPGADERLRQLFRLGVKLADEELRASVGAKFVSVLKEESEWVVRCYELGLFRGSDLAHVKAKDRSVVIDHFIGTMKCNFDERVCESAQGISFYLECETLEELVRILALAIYKDKPTSGQSSLVHNLLHSEVWTFGEGSTEVQEKFEAAIHAVKAEYKWNEEMKQVLDEMSSAVQVPF